MIYAWIGTVVAGLLIGMYIGGFWNEAKHSIETIAIQREEKRVDAAQDAITAKADTEAVAADTKVQTVFKTRLEYILKEIPVETVKKMDDECVVPGQFVSLWNTANQGVVPDAPREVDGEAHKDRHTGAETQ